MSEEKTLESCISDYKNLFKWRDWIPFFVGTVNLLYRAEDLPMDNATRTGMYITTNSIYNAGSVFAVACYYICNQ